MSNNSSKSFVKIAEAAKLLKVHKDTLRRWEKTGKINVKRDEKGHRLYDISKLEKPENNTSPATQSTFPPILDLFDHENTFATFKQRSKANEETIPFFGSSADTKTPSSVIPRLDRGIYTNVILRLLFCHPERLVKDLPSRMMNILSWKILHPSVPRGSGLRMTSLWPSKFSLIMAFFLIGFIFLAGSGYYFLTHLPSPSLNKSQIAASKTTSTPQNSDILGESADVSALFPGSVAFNIPTTFNDTVSFKKGINGLTFSTDSSGIKITDNTNNRSLTVTGSDVTIDQSLSSSSSPDLSSLNLKSSKNQVVFSSGITGTLTWTPTGSNKTITLPDTTDTLVGKATTDTLSNKTIKSGDSNTISGSFPDITGITSLGTVSTGTWNGTKIATGYGGTGLTTYTTGDLLYSSASNTLSKLAVGTAGQILAISGGIPIWTTVSSSGVTADSLDFAELADSMTLDTNWAIASSDSNYSINIDSGTFFVDTANNRIGINNTSPSYALDITGALNASGNIGVGGSLTSTGLAVFNGGLNVTGLSNLTGNVGVGTSLTVTSASVLNTLQTTGLANLNSLNVVNNANISGTLTVSGNVISSGGNVGGWTRDSSNGYIYTSTLTDKIGIGSSAPSSQLEVKATTNPALTLYAAGSGTNNIFEVLNSAGTTTYFAINSSGQLNANAFQLTDAAKAIVGTAVPGAWSNIASEATNDFTYRRAVSVTASSNLAANYEVTLDITTAATANQIYSNTYNQSDPYKDFRLFYTTDSGTTYAEVARNVTNFSSTRVTLTFQLQTAITSGNTSSTNYYLFYSNSSYSSMGTPSTYTGDLNWDSHTEATTGWSSGDTSYVLSTATSPTSQAGTYSLKTVAMVDRMGTFSTSSQTQLGAILNKQAGLQTSVGGTDYIYLVGGHNGTTDQSTISKAPISSNNIGTWATTGTSNPTVSDASAASVNSFSDGGTGNDGAITVSSNSNLNTTTMISGRSCADGGDAVNYSVTALTSTTATLSTTPASGCLTAGDEVLLINLQGTNTNYANVGNYESLTISSISTNTITFTATKTKSYGDNGGDTNIGTGSTNQKVMLQRVPNYTSVTVNNGVTLTAAAWNGTKGGVLFFRANGTVTVTGTISMNGNGYRGATTMGTGGYVGGAGGEAFCGTGGSGGNMLGNGGHGAAGGGGAYNYGDNTRGGNGYCGGGGGQGGDGSTTNWGGTGSASAGGAGGGGGYLAGGGGGGYGTAGNGVTGGSNGGTNSSGNGGNSAYAGGGGGGTYGSANLSTLFFGSGGGKGGNFQGATSGNGGNGGGIIFIAANSLTVTGAVSSNATNGGNGIGNGTGGGGGAGGSVFLSSLSLTLGTNLVTASKGTAGSGGYSGGANGGDGRIATDTPSVSGTTSPTYNANTATASLNFYVIGGKTGSTAQTAINKATISSDSTIGTFAATTQALPQALYGHTSITGSNSGNNYIYIIGGHNGTNTVNTVYRATVTSTGDITSAPTTSSQGQLPAAITEHATTSLSISGTTYVYAVGGTTDGASTGAVSTIYKSSLSSGNMAAWTTLTSLPAARYGAQVASATVGSINYLYIFGGYDSAGTPSTTVYRAKLDSSGDISEITATGQATLTEGLADHTTLSYSSGGSTYFYTLGGHDGTNPNLTVYKSTLTSDETNFYIEKKISDSGLDLSNKNDITFSFYSNSTAADLMEVAFSEDASSPTYSQTTTFTASQASTWETKTWDISGISSANKNSVKYLRFKVNSAQTTEVTSYIDNIQAQTEASGSDSNSAGSAVLGSANLSLNAQGSGVVRLNYSDPTDSTNYPNAAGSGGMIVYNGVDTPLFTVDSSGNVGIGRTGAISKLNIIGSGTSTGLNLLTQNSALSNFGLSVLDNGNVGIGTTSPQTGLYVTSNAMIGYSSGTPSSLSNGLAVSGNLGIGTTGPGSKLTVIGNVGIGTSGAGAALQVNGNGIFGWGTTSIAAPTNGLSINGNLGIGTTTANSSLAVSGNAHIGGLFQGITAPANGLFVDGNVGIGATTSNNKLDVWGNTRLAGTLSVDSTLTGLKGLFGYSSSTSLSSGAILGVNGNLGIGTTSPTFQLHATGNVGIGRSLTLTGLGVLNGGLQVTNINASSLTTTGNLGIGSSASISSYLSVGSLSSSGAICIAGDCRVSWPTAGGTYTASNGLTLSSSDFRLGGSLTQATAIDISGQNFGFLGNVGIGTSANTGGRLSVLGGNVGIGTTTANSLLSVAGGAHIGSIRQGIAAPTDGLFVDGNVGIGATTSSNKLDVWGNSKITGNLTAGGTLDISGLTTLLGNNAALTFTGSTPSISAPNSVLGIFAGGNVGIGTTTTSATLDVAGSFRVGLGVFDASGGTKSTNGSYTVWTFAGSGSFTPTASGTVDIQVIGGGGGGGNGGNFGGGGGAGQVVTQTSVSVTINRPLNITIGSGGGAQANGNSSTVTGTGVSVTANGGNAGASLTGGTSGNSYAGGSGSNDINIGGGGGGGSSGTGGNSQSGNIGGTGGAGTTTYDGTTRAGGGGGAGNQGSGSGTAGGGNGGNNQGGILNGYSATANTGSGGGGGVNGTGGTGGSGIVIIRHLNGTDLPNGAKIDSTGNITTYGNVGIGTTTPQSALTVIGNVGIGTSGAGAALQVNGGGLFGWGTTSVSLSSGAVLGVNGNVGIGTTSPTALLHVQGTGSMPSLLVTTGGNVGIGTSVTSSPLTVGVDGSSGNGAYLSTGGNWTNGSSFSFKENFTLLDQQKILEKINLLSITQWNYKLEDPNVKHIGPIAEEFYSLFGLGNDNKHISTIDPAGIALIGIQGLSGQISNIKLQMTSLEDKIASLSIQLSQNVGIGTTIASGLPESTSSASLQEATSPATTSATISDTLTHRYTDTLELTPPDLLLASSSAELKDTFQVSSGSWKVYGLKVSEATVSGKLTAYNLDIQSSLKSLGTTTLGSTTIAGELTVDGMMNITGNSLSTLSNLKLQNGPLAGDVDFFNGLVTIDKTGQITATSVKTNKLILDSKVLGEAKIAAGTNETVIDTSALTDKSKIFVTPQSEVDSSLFIADKIIGESFKVKIKNPASSDIIFNWMIIESP